MSLANIPEIADEFPGWEAWQSAVNRLYHARLRGSVPVMIVHAETVDGLRRQIVATRVLPDSRGWISGPMMS